ncbi:phage tail tape measure protein [Serratia ureilytica]|nr:phage tail tape measure protein [Serratia ureilytica]
MRRRVPPFINPVSPRKAVLICSVLTLCECWEMADTAQLVVGLQLNDTNFKNKLTAAYRTAGEQSAKFNRQAQQDAKKTDESYQRIGGTLGGLAGKLAGLAGVELSLQGLAATSRQYGQALTELASITVAATAQMKQLDDAARQASSASGDGGSRAEEMLKLAGGLNDSAAAWRDQAAAARGAAQRQATVAQSALDSANATLRQNDAEFGRVRLMEKVARQYGVNANFSADYNRLINEETEAKRVASAASNQLDLANQNLAVSSRKNSVASALASGALSVFGGPVGVAIQAGMALLYFHEQSQLARKSALELRGAVQQTTQALLLMSPKQLDVKALDLDEQYENQIIQVNKIKKEILDADSRISTLEKFDPFGQLKGVKAGRIRSVANLEDAEDGLVVLKESIERVKAVQKALSSGKSTEVTKPDETLAKTDGKSEQKGPRDYKYFPLNDNGKQQALDQYQQLRQEIEQAHLSSLEKITQDEQSAQAKLASTAKAAGAGQADVQRAMALNAEKYQRQRQQLAEQYAPGQAAVRKEQEVGKELKALYDGRLLTEREYHTASRMQQQETTRQRLKAETDALAAPRMNIAGDVDPVARLNNQLVQQQAQYQAYYQQGFLDKQRYEQLMQAATQESSDAQYQQALSLFGGQSRVHKMALGLVDMTRERTSGMMFDLLTGTQNFKQSMLGLMTSMTQSIIQQLIDLAMQALLTRTILSTFMNIGSGLLGGAASAGAGAAGSGAMGMPTGWQGYVPNAKGGVYASPSLSAFSGQIVSNPTLFAFARGAGLMGEAGPEAIMPLKRGADGSLGVRAIGGGQQSAAAPNVYITIENGGNVSSQAEPGWGEFGKRMGNIAAQESQKVINRNLMPGQPIWKAIKGM